jgi:hypothetical protein
MCAHKEGPKVRAIVDYHFYIICLQRVELINVIVRLIAVFISTTDNRANLTRRSILLGKLRNAIARSVAQLYLYVS